MHEHPILFSGQMVRAIMSGAKTMTRRVCKIEGLDEPDLYENRDGDLVDPVVYCPYGRRGDVLWVRETWWEPPVITANRLREGADTWPKYDYDALLNNIDREQYLEWGWKKRPSIFMPRPASRISLSISKIRIERLRDISEDDARAEGVDLTAMFAATYKAGFQQLWDSINGNRNGCAWKDNPWVWVIAFNVAKEEHAHHKG
jgi:hypothetical protein